MDAINDTVAAFYNDTDLLSGEFMAPPGVLTSSQFLVVAFHPLTTDLPTSGPLLVTLGSSAPLCLSVMFAAPQL